jgi:predicted phage terminase large subunit-like protein
MVDYEKHSAVLRLAARQHFWAFCCYMDFDFFFVRRRFLKDVAVLFQKLYEAYIGGEAINISVSMPPRSGKSYLTSMFCAWWLGVLPELSVMRNTCTGTLYDKLSYDTRAILTSEKYRRVFFGVSISQSKSNLSGWNTSSSRQVGYYGAGVGGTIIGFGANLAVVDDLYKSMADALSDTTNEKVKMWKQSAHDSRKEKNCPEIFIGTRWSVNDVIGEAIETGKVKPENCVIVPALVDGETFCDDVKSTAEYLQIRDEVAESVWMAEYMQQPYEVAGLLFPKSKLRFSNLDSVDYSQALWAFAIGDPADRGGDFYAMPYLYVMPNFDVLVRDVVFNKDGIDANTRRIAEKAMLHGMERLVIEANGGWISSVSLLKRQLGEGSAVTVSAYANTVDKIVRILSNYEFVIKHFVFDDRYKEYPEYASFISNLTSFKREGNNANDDAADVVAAAANAIKVKYGKTIYGHG